MMMISMLYPNTPGATFDYTYYTERHMADSIARLSDQPGFKGVTVARGVGGDAPGTEPTYVAICHYLFDSLESFLAAFAPHAAALQADLANYSSAPPTIQISSVDLLHIPLQP